MKSRCSTPETALAKPHLNNMGKDEMNLAEFPLATLADHAPRGCKTLVYEDRIWDRGQGQHRVRRLTISASDKFGLPTAIDDEVILGLVQVSKAAGFVDRQVRFSRYQLIQLLGWRDEGRSYRRLNQSLKRWLGVTLYYENAWWDRERKRWADADFHLLEKVVSYRRPKLSGVASVEDDAGPLSSFTWNEVVFRSFQSGFLKKLDLDFYRRLKRATTKRMYRYLDKHFHFSSTFRRNLRVFACEHIGLSRRYDAAQLKRRLNPAIEELEKAGYLVPMPANERVHKLRRGEWEVVFVRRAQARKQQLQKSRLSDLENGLIDRGVTAISAVRLVREYPADLINAKLAVFDALRKNGDRRISRNPAGYLVKSIREDYAPPAGFPAKADPPVSEAAIVGRGDSGSRPRRQTADTRLAESDRQIDQYLDSLSVEARDEMKSAAVATAHGLPADGLRRSLASGKTAVADQYRRLIVRQYVKELLEQRAAA